jgi:CBS domain-containing protein
LRSVGPQTGPIPGDDPYKEFTMKIEELMTRPVVTCHADDPMSCAAQRMWENDCGALPVVDGEGHTVAVITDRDICMAAWTTGKTLYELPVRAAMSHEVFCCHPQDSAQVLVRTMSEHRVRRVPIVDEDGHPIGIVSINDVTRNTARLRQSTSWAEARDLMQTMAAICEPRVESAPSVERGAARAAVAAASAAPIAAATAPTPVPVTS